MLGDKVSAREEFAQLTAAARAQPEVLELEWSLHAEVLDWGAACAAAERLIAVAPDRSLGWIHRAYALRRLPGGGLSQAWDALRPAHDRFPDHPLIAYNLACYASQLGQLDQAWEWITRALARGRRVEILGMALNDPDLAPLWPRLRNLPWQ